jgi:homoserine dehydrogenase
VRLSVLDRPGAMAKIATRMADRSISLDSIMQKRTDADEGSYVSVVIVTHATTETSIREALALTMQDGFVRDKPQVIRIERP